jgi:diguanylate cyclase (GGDEF)-like protein
MDKKKILIVDDDVDIRLVLEECLAEEGYAVITSDNGQDTLVLAKSEHPDLILLDIMMPQLDGMLVKTTLNQDTSTSNIPVIFLTAKDTMADKVNGLRLGAEDYLVKPFNSEELVARIDGILGRRDFYEKISMTDELTGLYNVTFFKKQVLVFFDMARRYKKVFSLAMIDLDKFKQINDTYGHMIGDFVLTKFSSIAKIIFRRSDIITRYGGDEFAVIMPETNYKQASITIERLKKNINGKVFVCKYPQVELVFSFSAGIATYDDTICNESQMFEQADSRLYEDKNRNE